MTLQEDFVQFCYKQNFDVKSPKSRGRADFIVMNDDGNVGVIVKDWGRAVGVDIVIRAEQAKDSSRLFSRVIILTNSYSDPAKSMADRINVGLFSKIDLEDNSVLHYFLEFM